MDEKGFSQLLVDYLAVIEYNPLIMIITCRVCRPQSLRTVRLSYTNVKRLSTNSSKPLKW